MFSSGSYWLAVLAVIGIAVFLLFIRPARRRRKLAQAALPPQWQPWLERAVPHYDSLPPDLRQQLERHLKIFLAEKSFYGCDGLVIEDRHRVTIAAQACLLLMGRSVDEFNAVQAILLYPSAFRVPPAEPGILAPWDGSDVEVVTEEDDVHLGESWGEGRVILSWDDIEHEMQCREAGRPGEASVVVHEFAHQLDQAEGISGALSETRTGPAQSLAKAYSSLRQAVERDEPTPVDGYGATSPEEFLAVVTETFIHQPHELRAWDPDLYRALSRLYRMDLAGLLDASNRP